MMYVDITTPSKVCNTTSRHTVTVAEYIRAQMFMTHDVRLKKPSLPVNDLSSYRPISNLSFISKVLEKAVSCRLNVHLNCNNTSNVFKSA